MTSHSEAAFSRELHSLLNARAAVLKHSLWPKPGRRLSYNRRVVAKTLNHLQEIAETTALRSNSAQRMLCSYDNKRQWHINARKGWGPKAKKAAFRAWYGENVQVRNCVYVFWARHGKCLYVGRTLNHRASRPTNHFGKDWFREAKRIDVYKFDRKRDVPRFECLLTHKLQPWHQGMKPSEKKWSSKCPVCEAGKRVRREVKKFFRIR
jgi:hypothetical protein